MAWPGLAQLDETARQLADDCPELLHCRLHFAYSQVQLCRGGVNRLRSIDVRAGIFRKLLLYSPHGVTPRSWR